MSVDSSENSHRLGRSWAEFSYVQHVQEKNFSLVSQGKVAFLEKYGQNTELTIAIPDAVRTIKAQEQTMLKNKTQTGDLKMTSQLIDQVAAQTLTIAGTDSKTQRTVASMLLRDAGYEGDRLNQLVGRVLDLLAR